jgi:hypothetical protein
VDLGLGRKPLDRTSQISRALGPELDVDNPLAHYRGEVQVIVVTVDVDPFAWNRTH